MYFCERIFEVETKKDYAPYRNIIGSIVHGSPEFTTVMGEGLKNTHIVIV